VRTDRVRLSGYRRFDNCTDTKAGPDDALM
jgi:hypothetical protein